MANYPKKALWSMMSELFRVREDLAQLSHKPRISIILPVYNPDKESLESAVNSVSDQFYTNWELCIVNDVSSLDETKKCLRKYAKRDRRIKVEFPKSYNDAATLSNIAAKMASGEYLALLDPDGELTSNALYEVVKTIGGENADIIYSDECLISPVGQPFLEHFKPDFSPDLLLASNYLSHLLVFRKSLLREIGGFRSEFSGEHNYDLILRLTERTDSVSHIPAVLYRWRQLPDAASTNEGSDETANESGLHVLEEALARRGIQGSVHKTNSSGIYHVKRQLTQHFLVSIIIPFKDKVDLLEKCVQSILNKTTFQNYEIICINNNSRENMTYDAVSRLQKEDSRIRFVDYNKPFNYSELNNFGVSLAKGDHVVLMNNDIEIITPDWIDCMLEHSQREEVGAVGGKLYYPDDTIQHAGIIIGIGGVAGHSHRHCKKDENGYFYRLRCIHNVSAVTGALMMVKKELFEEVDGLDREHFSIALNDVDFCLKLRQAGYLNILTPYCEAYHHESASRGIDDTPEKIAKFEAEKVYFRKKWKDILYWGDPYYNINLTLDGEDLSVKANEKTES